MTLRHLLHQTSGLSELTGTVFEAHEDASDGALETAAGRTVADYAHAMRLMQPRYRAWSTEVLRCSALTGARHSLATWSP